MDNHKIRPSRWWYGLAAAIDIAVFASFLIFFFAMFLGLRSGIQRVTVPGTHRVRIVAAGNYTVLHEYETVVNGKPYSVASDAARDLECSLQTLDGLQRIPVTPTPPYSKYKFGKREGVSVFRFTIGRPGTYVLMAHYPEGAQTPRIVLAIRRRVLETLLVPAALFVSIASVAVLVAAGVFWVTFFKRRKAKKGSG
ncbi:MAG TPA: hypothetical protein VMX13_06620 [Sedimentisphaerales bacterium]|nr:hypothetical protein [Sedimentisphaerales bacterium]